MKMRVVKYGGFCLVLLLLLFALASCSNGGNGNAEINHEAEDILEQNEQRSSDAPQAGPVYGGKLTIISTVSPTNMGSPLEHTTTNYAARFPGVESLLGVSEERTLEGVLAESWEEDIENLKITFKLREGIKFHNGKELTAEDIKKNFEYIKHSPATLRYNDFLDSIEVVDKNTVVFHLNRWHNQVIVEWGIIQIFDIDTIEAKGEGWATTNLVATGPFILKEFQRDVRSLWVRFDDYWQEGKPYLDEVEYLYIPEQSTGAAMMEAGEAQIWLGADGLNTKNLMDRGFVRQTGWGSSLNVLVPNTYDEDSPFQDIRVRQALQHAIDKEALCEALGYGLMEPVHSIAPEGEWGGGKVYYEYNPDKAKQLLQEAGYENGLDVPLLALVGSGGRNELAEAVAGQLEKIGIRCKIDIADAGRYYAETWNGVWEGLALGISGSAHDFLTGFQRWWGHNGIYKGFKRPEELLQKSRDALLVAETAEKIKITEEMVDMVMEGAYVVPLTYQLAGFIHDGTVHTNYLRQGNTRWDFADVWLER